MNRRKFIGTLSAGTLGLALGGTFQFANGEAPFIKKSDSIDKVIVLGIDGMDPHLLMRFVNQGVMPNFKKLIDNGGFKPLGTSLPPQSPVAWSNFITGMNPGGHGIYDFIHRDPVDFIPYLSTTLMQPSSKKITLGNWDIPLEKGKIELLRKGSAFWTHLESHDIPTWIFKIPANFPPVESKSQTISGMGTPDILGTYGTFSYYTDKVPENAEDFSGGKVFPVELVDNKFTTTLVGPVNSIRRNTRNAEIPFTVYRDYNNPVAKISIQGREILLNEGEWSSWITLDFNIVPHLSNVSGICRFYLKEVYPDFKLYVTPVNIDPANPSMPISTSNYSQYLCEELGPFYTQGFPEDTKALSNGIFSDDEYLEQANMVLDERIRIFDHELNRFNEGFFFYYFSSIDQNSHMMLRTMDVNHPLYNANASPNVKNAIKNFYSKIDNVLFKTMKKVDNHTTLMILSDHGFAPFYKEFHLSTWLVENGYTVLLDHNNRDSAEFFENVDWNKTKAYALGINSLYINLKDREFNGIVDPGDSAMLINEIGTKLEAQRDPENGKKIVSKAYKPHDAYSGECVDLAPDLIVGYEPGYRISDLATLGQFPENILEIRKDKWSADHCMDPRFVPGVLISNKQIVKNEPALQDLASTILNEFKINETNKHRSIFKG